VISKILIPADGSVNGAVALDYGIYTALKLNASLTGLHVLEVNLLQGPLLADISGAVGTALNEKADFVIDAFRKRCLAAGVPPEIKKVTGKIDDAISEEGRNADLILMAKKGEHFHFQEGMFPGSVTENVIRNSGKPVMITPDRFHEIESMAVAYDGSSSAAKALAFSLKLSHQAAWPLTAVIISSDLEKAALLSAEIEETAQAQETECEVIILSGEESEEILNFIKEGAVELMAMGAYGNNRLRELLLGSTTSRVVQNSPIPVLLTH